MRRLLALTLLAASLLVFVPGQAGAQETDTPAPVLDAPTALPKPNSGAEPEVQGDRGTATQYLVMAGILAGMGTIVLMIRRESQRKLAARENGPGGS